MRRDDLKKVATLSCFNVEYNYLRGCVWPSGWVVRKVASGPGFEPSAKGGVSSKGLSLSFAFVRMWVQCLHGVVPA